jgi:hypothetical protein
VLTRSRAARPVLFGVAGVLLALLVASQVLLPHLAERRLAGELEQYGPRPDVKVRAFPALKLLLGRVDRIEIDQRAARIDTPQLIDELSESGHVDAFAARVGELSIGMLGLSEVRVAKDGDDVTAAATVTLNELQRALRDLANLRVLPPGESGGIVLAGQVTVFGRTIAGRARVRAADGRLVVGVEGLPLGTITLVDDARLRIIDVGAREVPGGYRLSLRGALAPRAGS